ncbi:MAG TPA: hypothetical protein VGB18_00940, partial [Candidatus Thermoplasmatota archaeon]
ENVFGVVDVGVDVDVVEVVVVGVDGGVVGVVVVGVVDVVGVGDDVVAVGVGDGLAVCRGR